MLAKRVIPCLDVHGDQVTRGVRFGKAEAGELRNVGDPVELAVRYNAQGADEMVFFDITATAHGRATMVDVIERVADQCFMPLTVGGGIRSVDDMFIMLRAGADKVSINSAALADPQLIRAGAEKFGSQCIVVSVDARRVAPNRWEVYSHGGRRPTGREAVAWASEAVALGAGEVVLNSIDADGTRAGFDLEITRRVSEAVGVPVVASGGAGSLEHMADVLLRGQADAVLAASIFHFGEFTVRDVKAFLAARQIPVRWTCPDVLAPFDGTEFSENPMIDQFKYNADGLIPAIVQDYSNGRVLMMAWMNRASLEKTLETGKTHFWSRSRQKFWMKGESSGHTQSVRDIAVDCDGDTLLIRVDQTGAACHEGYRSCFYRSLTDQGRDLRVTEPRLVDPKAIYGKP